MTTTRLIFITGKGGTGKSAVTAAMATARARTGESVLAIDMATSPGLASHFGSRPLTYQPTEVRDGLFAMTIDRAAALDEYLKLQLHVPRGAPTKQIAAALSVLAETAPGVREIISIGKPLHETWKGTWDTVIVDASSLGQFQSYMRAPQTIAQLVPTGAVRRQASRMERTLSDRAASSVIIVTNPAELPVSETLESIEVLASEHLGPTPIVAMNRVLDTSGIDRNRLSELPEGPVRDAASLQTHLEDDQATWLDAIDFRISLPYLAGVFTPQEVSLQLSDVIGAII
jgi:anion-transporting  ArsA/GET3 family ATPase